MKFKIHYFTCVLMIFLSLAACKKNNVGKIFPTQHLVDLNGTPVNIEQIKGNKKVIIDYWFIGCKPCLKEMQEFPDLLKNDKDLKIISISVDAYSIWKNALVNTQENIGDGTQKYISESGVQSIAKNNLDNWVHYNYEDGRSKGWPSIEDLEVNAYPTYLLLDEYAVILKQSNAVKECLKL